MCELDLWSHYTVSSKLGNLRAWYGWKEGEATKENSEILPWHAGVVLGKSKLKLRLECQGQEKVSTAVLVG